MLKHRIIPVLLYRDGMLVKGKGFDSWRNVGTAMQAVRLYNTRNVDELIFLDIGATPAGRGPDFEHVGKLAEECEMPLTVGGGVHSVEDIRRLLAVGADKVALNTAAVERPNLIREAADKYGSQCITVSIDAQYDGIVINCGTQFFAHFWPDWAKRVEQLGAGEILLGSVDRDGGMEGYDIEGIRRVSKAVSIPVVAVGGAGKPAHMAAAIKAGASAVAASSLFQFTDVTPRDVARHLDTEGIPVRL